MSLCVYCHKQKGKRSCPALGGLICASCCGQHRGQRINCPISCRYFKAHEGYQRERLSVEFHTAWLSATEPLYRQKKYRSIDFIARLEIAIFTHYRDKTAGTDREVLDALEFLKRRVSPVLVVETTTTALGNELFQVMEEYVKREPLDLEHMQEAIEVLLGFLQNRTHTEDPRHFLHGLLGHVEKYFDLPKEAKEAQGAIVTPSIVTPDQVRGLSE
ncbi:hypothetical protein HYR54_01970 [Candidatus Acetothermia bacterium]|nr:hypothetical protein [Candidatus Acetothermia bacterium]MBI3459336.1 hypothetical protein [Candidatus Acetothermia bacterium]